LKSWKEAAAWSGSEFLHKNQSGDDKMGLFGLKINWDMAWAFLVNAALMVSLPDFPNSGSASNHNLRSPFCHFGYFSSFTALKREFIRLYNIFLSQ
jgi:hypothetical protein